MIVLRILVFCLIRTARSFFTGNGTVGRCHSHCSPSLLFSLQHGNLPGRDLAASAASVEHTSPKACGPFPQPPYPAGCPHVLPSLSALERARAPRERVGEGTLVRQVWRDVAPGLPSTGVIRIGRGGLSAEHRSPRTLHNRCFHRVTGGLLSAAAALSSSQEANVGSGA